MLRTAHRIVSPGGSAALAWQLRARTRSAPRDPLARGSWHGHRWNSSEPLLLRPSLWFLALPSPDVAIARVAERVSHGGHAVSDAVVHRRFAAGLSYFENLYKPLVDSWVLYDNAGEEPLLLDWGERR